MSEQTRWIAIDFGGNRTRAAYRNPETGETLNLSFPTVFGLKNSADGSELVWGSEEIPVLAPTNTLLLQKSDIGKTSHLLAPMERSRLGVTDLLTRLFKLIKRTCEEEWFEGKTADTCFLTGESRDKKFREMAKAARAAGFEEVGFRNSSICTAAAWYRRNAPVLPKEILFCDLGNGEIRLDTIRFRHNGFDRSASAAVKAYCDGSGEFLSNLFSSVVQKASQDKSEQEQVKWNARENAFVFLFKQKMAAYFSGNTPDMVFPLGKKKINLPVSSFADYRRTVTAEVVKVLRSVAEHYKEEQVSVFPALLLAGGHARFPKLHEKLAGFWPAPVWESLDEKENPAAGCAGLVSEPFIPEGVTPEEKKFLEVRRQAQSGGADAKEKLGKYYSCGFGTAKMPEEAFSLFSQAAEEKNAKAVYYLSLCCGKGIGTFTDTVRAKELCIEAAMMGCPDAQYRYGRILSEMGGSSNLRLARQWFQKAADQNHAKAARRTAELDKALKFVERLERRRRNAEKKKGLFREILTGTLLSFLIFAVGDFLLAFEEPHRAYENARVFFHTAEILLILLGVSLSGFLRLKKRKKAAVKSGG